ncbi:MAG: PAS domain S-box protein, partial [Bacteriovorax sp.]|nr:PAS domain S-box protein [Bacteriovorax sp.]
MELLVKENQKNTKPMEATPLFDKGFRSLVEGLGIGVIVHDANTKILYSNQAASKLLGLNKDEMHGVYAIDPTWKFIREDNTLMPIEEYPVNRVCISGQPLKGLVIGLLGVGRSAPTWVLCDANPEYNEEGELVQVVVSFSDITHEKEMKEKMLELKILFDAALDQSQVGIVIAEAQSGKLLYLNQAGFELMGGTCNELVEDFDINKLFSTWKLLELDGRSVCREEMPLISALIQKKKISKELVLKKIDGLDQIVWTNASPIFKPDGSLMAAIAIFFDTSARHRLEKELIASKELAEKTMMMKSRFLDVAAHELRTPVTSFSLLVQLAQKRLLRGVAVDGNTLDRLHSQAERISRLVIDLLDVSRLEREGLKLHLELKDVVN